MKPEQQKELIDEFEGLPKLVLKKIVANTGKYQLSIPGSIAKHTTGTILGILPFTGVVSNNANTAIIDNLQKIIEHSLTIPEIIEVFEEYEAEKIKKLLLIRDYVAAEQKKNAKIADLEKQLREAKNEIAELKSQLETQIEEEKRMLYYNEFVVLLLGNLKKLRWATWRYLKKFFSA
ncbi:6629_t:CDS:2, partial [Gigaspora margarita]